ncbi:hypothetical protein LTR17_011563 [Elasticomyces elasticus]|nr:hypothetical protein LTR17_011563 [Elasticomyces elasticus]
MADGISAPMPRPPKAIRILTIRPRTHFFTLPRELRDVVYNLTLVQASQWEKPHEPQCLQVDLKKAWQWPVHHTRYETVNEGDRNIWRLPAFLSPVEQLTSRHDRLTDEEVNNCWDAGCHSRLGIGLRAVNRQIHEETEELFWSQNVFCYQSAVFMLHHLAVCAGEGVCKKPCMPKSAKAKVQRLSFLQHRRDPLLAYGNEQNIVRALGELPALREIEMPAKFALFHLEELAGLSLPLLTTVYATEFRPVAIGDRDDRARVDLYLSRRIDIPRRCSWHPIHFIDCGHRCYKRRQRHPDSLPCRDCFSILRGLIESRLESWVHRYSGFATSPDRVTRTMAIVEQRFETWVPTQLTNGEPLRVLVYPDDEGEDEDLKPEEPRAMGGVVEDERCGGIDGYGA